MISVTCHGITDDSISQPYRTPHERCLNRVDGGWRRAWRVAIASSVQEFCNADDLTGLENDESLGDLDGEVIDEDLNGVIGRGEVELDTGDGGTGFGRSRSELASFQWQRHDDADPDSLDARHERLERDLYWGFKHEADGSGEIVTHLVMGSTEEVAAIPAMGEWWRSGGSVIRRE